MEKRLSRQGMAWYPPSIADFMAFEPDRYSPGEPPVECPISATMIVGGRHLVGARCGNKKLMVSCPSVARNEQCARSIAAVDIYERVKRKPVYGRKSKPKTLKKPASASIYSQHSGGCSVCVAMSVSGYMKARRRQDHINQLKK